VTPPWGGRREGAGRKPKYDSAMLSRVTVMLPTEVLERMDAMIAASQDPSSLVTYGGRAAFIREALWEYIQRRG
jgi:metal-responsive CopG/Arc/MetJ family transcriptional regulator